MKRKAKFLLLAMAFLAVLTGICGCQRQEDEPQKTAREYGMELVAVMAEMVQDESYGAVFSSGPEIQEVTQALAKGSYDTPAAVYKISAPDLAAVASALGETDFGDGFSDALREQLNHQAASVIVNQLTSSQGTYALAASSIYRANRIFVCRELETDCIYLYLFENGCPIAVTFTVGEGSAVSATGAFVINDALQSSFAEGTPEVLEQLLQLFGCEAEKLP